MIFEIEKKLADNFERVIDNFFDYQSIRDRKEQIKYLKIFKFKLASLIKNCDKIISNYEKKH